MRYETVTSRRHSIFRIGIPFKTARCASLAHALLWREAPEASQSALQSRKGASAGRDAAPTPPIPHRRSPECSALLRSAVP
eukprot:scaffold13_cov241-Pinguiococcus_pyrenoidosus.AAC.4